MPKDITQISLEGLESADHHFVDVRVHIDLEPHQQPRRRKLFAIPLDYGVLMPIDWDGQELVARVEAADYFKAAELIAEADADRLAEISKDLRSIVTLSESPTYADVVKPLRHAARSGSLPSSSISLTYDVEEDLGVHPFKLLLAFLAADKAIIDEEGRDVFDLIFDKVALAALLPAVFSSTVWPAQAAGWETPEALDSALATELAKLSPFGRPRSSLLLQGEVSDRSSEGVLG